MILQPLRQVRRIPAVLALVGRPGGVVDAVAAADVVARLLMAPPRFPVNR